jgi:hypothetical protein
MKNSIALLTAGAAVLAIAGCSMYPKTLPPGEYEHTEKSSNASGTETEKNVKTNVYYDEDGNKRVTQETETTKDPKGLMNKTTSKTTKTY